MAIDNDKLMDFLHRFVGDLGAALSAGNVVIGNRLGLYASLANGPATPAELAQRTGTDPRYVTEWLRGQASGGYVERTETDGVGDLLAHRGAGVLPLRPGQRHLRPGRLPLRARRPKGEERVAEAIRTGTGIGWHEGDKDMLVGCESSSAPDTTPT